MWIKLLIVLSVFFGACSYGPYPMPLPPEKMPHFYLAPLPQEVVGLIRQQAYSRPSDEILRDGCEGMIQHVKDHQNHPLRPLSQEELCVRGIVDQMVPLARFLPKTLVGDFDQSQEGYFGGVGMLLHQLPDGSIYVISFTPNSVAQEEGVMEGDILTQVNDALVSDLGLEGTLVALSGPPGTYVRLKVSRPTKEGGEERDFTLTRNGLIKDPVSLIVHNDVAILRFGTLTQRTLEYLPNLHERINTMTQERRLLGYVLDLRQVSGSLDVALEVANLFLGDRIAVGRIRAHEEMGIQLYSDERQMFAGPFVILIDEGTAFGGEMLAASLRDATDVTLVGMKTAGRTAKMKSFTLSDGSVVALPVGEWVCADGESLMYEGIDPDFVVSPSSSSGGNTPDTQLEMALSLMTGR